MAENEKTLQEQHSLNVDSAQNPAGKAASVEAVADHHPGIKTSEATASDSAGNDMEDFCPRCMHPIADSSTAFCPYCRCCINCS